MFGKLNFAIKSDIFKGFFICKNILKKLSCYHDNYFRYFTFGKYNGQWFCQQGEGFCMHVFSSFIKNILKRLAKRLHEIEFYLKLKLILRIMTYLTYIYMFGELIILY